MINEKIKIAINELVNTRNEITDLKDKLDDIQNKLKDARKLDRSSKTFSENLKALNEKREDIKKAISDKKSKYKKLYDVSFELIEEEARNNCSYELNELFSMLFDKKISLITFSAGDNFDNEKSEIYQSVVTRDKKQNLIVIKLVEFGLFDEEEKTVLKKARVNVAKYIKKGNVGEIING